MKFNLSDLREVIRSRRSIPPEKYKARKVLPDMLNEMLNNALWAPTHGLTQPWHFVVFQEESREGLGSFLADTYKNETEESSFLQAKYDKLKSRPLMSSVVIAICMKRQPIEKIPEIEEIEAVACAVQNMHLTATAYGLGCFWSSPAVVYSDEMKSFLKLSEKDKCLGLLYVGYPAESEWPKSHRKPLEYHVEWRK